MKNTLSALIILAVLACAPEAGPRPGESPFEAAARLATTLEPSEVAQSLRTAASERGDGFLLSDEAFARGGRQLLMEGEIGMSFRVLQAAEILFPDSWRIFQNLGEVAIYLGDRDVAQEKLERAFALDSMNSDAGWILPELDRRIMEAQRETTVRARFQQGESTGLVGPYLGQEPPGLIPEVFAPGIISTRGGHEFSCTFSPDGREFYFNRGPNIYVALWREDGWTAPAFASFNSEELDHEPFISADGGFLFFGSGRPRADAPPWGPYGIWRMSRTDDGWSDPVFLFPGMYVTATSSGDAYLTDVFRVTGGGIGVHRMVDGNYGPLERIQDGPNLMTAAHPLIAPDGSFMIFDGQGRLFISFSLDSGVWSDPVHLEELDTGGNLMTASLSPDGAYLFYYSFHDIYWVSTEVLDPYRADFIRGH